MRRNITDQILFELKMRGGAVAQTLADHFFISKEGIRKHLLNLAKDDLVQSELRREGVGRPYTYYTLTKKGLASFPDTHADITVQLLQSVHKLFGQSGVDSLIQDREESMLQHYKQTLASAKTLEEKLQRLAEKRSQEGYMAEWKAADSAYYFIENHCPICAAAQQCQGFCRAEINTFQSLIGPAFKIQRVQYILADEPRCTYKIERIHEEI